VSGGTCKPTVPPAPSQAASSSLRAWPAIQRDHPALVPGGGTALSLLPQQWSPESPSLQGSTLCACAHTQRSPHSNPCVHMHTCVHTQPRTHKLMCTQTCTCEHACTQMHTGIATHHYMCTQTCMLTHAITHNHTHTHICTYIHMHQYARTAARTRAHAWTLLQTHTHARYFFISYRNRAAPPPGSICAR